MFQICPRLQYCFGQLCSVSVRFRSISVVLRFQFCSRSVWCVSDAVLFQFVHVSGAVPTCFRHGPIFPWIKASNLKKLFNSSSIEMTPTITSLGGNTGKGALSRSRMQYFHL